MELTQHGFLEELLAPRRDNTWNTFPNGVNEFFPSGWNFDSLEENPNPPFVGYSTPFDCPFSGQAYPFLDGFTEIETPYTKNDKPPFPSQEDYPSMVEDEDLGFLGSENQSMEENNNGCKVEMEQAADDIPSAFNMVGLCGEKRSKAKKLEGQPSKNLMAERRRRKRLNDRLSMLRSIVPKISKMDRTSILGDAIDYMKELLERINKLKAENMEDGTDQIDLMRSKELKPNEVLVRNSPKFNVERRDMDTRIGICCAAKPGLLLSTVNTLEALGLEIQQCVISCFNDFSVHASCSEGAQERALISSEDIKQALFRNAGYGGRCL
ncbi:transcription factor bHLH93-like [Alnus glutinosa]|uniref:transcription factor bHLH93-like n=1 Tax=Alnus glutinosa TaxID=3517 RepID=UPI002D793254|nr:transcription factor bHLH93-like [Alnus glutinosa]